MGQWQVPTDRCHAKGTGLLKELFQSILKIEIRRGKMFHFLGDREGDTPATSESSLSSQVLFIYSWNKIKIQKTEQATLHIWAESSLFLSTRESANMPSCIWPCHIQRDMGLVSYGAWTCKVVSTLQTLPSAPITHANFEQNQSLSTEQTFNFQTIQEQTVLKAEELLKKLYPSFLQIIHSQRSQFSLSAEPLHIAAPHNITI